MRTKKIACIIITMFFMVSLTSQKFAFVDTDYILDQMDEYQKAQKQLDDLSEQWQKELNDKMLFLEKKVNELKRDEILLPVETRNEREQEISTLQLELREYQSKQFGVGGDLFRKRKELIQPIQRKIYKAIEALSNENNYSFVLDKSKNSNILYADPKYDKSDAVVRKLKTK